IAAQAGNASATIAWSAPVSDGGTKITSYTVGAMKAGVPTGVNVTVPSPATGALLSGLTNGTTYTFVVRATNAIGDSPASAPSNSLTPTGPASAGCSKLFGENQRPNGCSSNLAHRV